MKRIKTFSVPFALVTILSVLSTYCYPAITQNAFLENKITCLYRVTFVDTIPKEIADTAVDFSKANFQKQDSILYYVYESDVYYMTLSGRDFYNLSQDDNFDYLYFTFSRKNPFSLNADQFEDNMTPPSTFDIKRRNDLRHIKSDGRVSNQGMWVRPSKLYTYDVQKFLDNLLNIDKVDLKNNGSKYTILVTASLCTDMKNQQYVGLELSVLKPGSSTSTFTTMQKTHPCPYCY